VLVFIDGANEVTLPPPVTRVVPVEVVYQSMVQPLGAVALKVTVPLPQRLLALAPVGASGTAFTVPLTRSRVALTQPVVVFRACA
jgi:hypothetical protein